MVAQKEDIHNLVERLREHDQKTAFDFLQYLIDRSEKKPTGWAEIDKAKPDDEPLTKEELRQLNSDAGYVTGEEARREFGLQVDLP
ncbi:MAG: XRE family transcriptional regulator [Peptococcaceae bacterium BRH_c4a]|nr:MAG: XRE family transcriptional regulator [Peptococcaceae bacterium BRH_c4a]